MRAGQDGRRFAFGTGAVHVGADGAVRQVEHPRGRPVLLQEDSGTPEAVMHEPARRWGKGFIVANGRGRRFDEPAELTWHDDGVDLRHELAGLRLTVRRRIDGEGWTETYLLENPTDSVVEVGSWAISTPWRDVYGSSGDSLRRAVHTHVWTGGADSWVWAVPMDGTGPGLGLRLIEGELWAYSVESRDEVTSSNVRGHIYLHVTDRSRAPHAMGGQPRVTLPPGGGYRLIWHLGWYDDAEAFRAQRRDSVELAECAAQVGEPLPVVLADGASAEAALPLTAEEPGVRQVDVVREGRRSRVAVLFHPPLREVAERRVRFLLEHQRPRERAGSRRHAFLPYDNESGLTVLPGAWSDWSDGRERIGSALLLQECRRLGWGDAGEVADALDGYQAFVTEHLLRPDGTVLDGSTGRPPGPDGPPHFAGRTEPRLYNVPWFARFLLDQGDLDAAARVLTRFYDLGGAHFLAFELGSVVGDVSSALRAAGRDKEADHLTGRLMHQARTYLDHGEDLPAHEVNFEQSMVAPLLDLLLAAHVLAPDLVPEAELLRRLDWLTAFGADQPDVRLRHMPIRHWDGYWFGSLRLWGDVFPHYWSVLSAAVFLSFPDALLPAGRAARLRAAGRAILRGNLVAFAADGSATCAFVYPSCVNGRPAHVADPLANDQDWALVYALRHGLTDES